MFCSYPLFSSWLFHVQTSRNSDTASHAFRRCSRGAQLRNSGKVHIQQASHQVKKLHKVHRILEEMAEYDRMTEWSGDMLIVHHFALSTTQNHEPAQASFRQNSNQLM